MRWPYPEFVLTNIICIENALKRTEIIFVLTVFVLTGISYNRVRTNEVLLYVESIS